MRRLKREIINYMTKRLSTQFCKCNDCGKKPKVFYTDSVDGVPSDHVQVNHECKSQDETDDKTFWALDLDTAVEYWKFLNKVGINL